VRLAKAAILAGLALILAGCERPQAEPDADRMGRRFIDAIQRDDWTVLDPALSPALANDPNHNARFQALRAKFPADPPWSIKLISSSRSRPLWPGAKAAREQTTLNYIYGFSGRSLAVDLTVERSGEKTIYDRGLKLAGKDPFKTVKLYQADQVTVTPISADAVKTNAFWARGKGPAHLAFLLAVALSPLLMVAAAVAAARSRGLKHKWWWALGAFVGLGSVWMNWTTGQIGVVPVAVNLLGFGATKGLSPLAPWILRFSLPAGALAVLIRLKTLPKPPA
jgi:hypothetical protein